MIATVCIGIIGLCVSAILHVTSGRGADTYQNVYGLAIHYTSVLITLAAFLVVLAVALIFRMWDRIAWWRLRNKIERGSTRRSG
jgi:hypothetical protein